MKKQFLVLGSGRWGSAMAIYLANLGFPVCLACRDSQRAKKLQSERYSTELPGFSFPENLTVIADFEEFANEFSHIVISTPVSHLQKTLSRLNKISAETVLIGINKGIEKETLQTPPQILRAVFTENPIAHLGGPCFPEGLIRKEFPASETLACSDETIGKSLQEMMSSESFRIYLSRDLEGVAFLGALKNIYAIAAGIIEALKLSEESLSILLTRSLAELKKFCAVMSIPEETLYGLSGLGDLALTCYSPSGSRNKTFGELLVKTGSCEKAFEAMNHASVEGYHTLFSIRRMIDRFPLEMPIAEMIYGVVYEDIPPLQAIMQLMSRPLKFED